MPALQHFLRDELGRRDWSIEEFASRAGLSTSSGYLIIRDGKDNVRQDTFEGIAAAFSMTPAELMVAIGKGAATDDPGEAIINALYRQVPDEHKSVVTSIIRGLAIAPMHAKTHRNDVAKTRRAPISTQSDMDDDGPHNPLRVCYSRLTGHARGLAVAHS